MIPRTLKDREVNYATNERELLGIVRVLEKLRHIQNDLVTAFPATKFVHCKSLEADIFDRNEMLEIITTEHNRARRAPQENAKQIMEDYYFPKMVRVAKKVALN